MESLEGGREVGALRAGPVIRAAHDVPVELVPTGKTEIVRTQLHRKLIEVDTDEATATALAITGEFVVKATNDDTVRVTALVALGKAKEIKSNCFAARSKLYAADLFLAARAAREVPPRNPYVLGPQKI